MHDLSLELRLPGKDMGSDFKISTFILLKYFKASHRQAIML